MHARPIRMHVLVMFMSFSLILVKGMVGQDSVEELKPSYTFYGGGEALIFRPYFQDPTGIIRMEGNGGSREDFQSLDFRFNPRAGYRTWLGMTTPYGVGVRGSYWDFSPGSASVSSRAPANGFGSVSHPEFGSIDIGSTIPNETLSAQATFSARVAIGELMQRFHNDLWDWTLSAGIEHAWLNQGYHAQLVHDTNGLVGLIDYERQMQGTGPTIAVGSSLQLARRIDLFGGLRSSLLFGRTNTTLNGGEDLDLFPPLLTSFPSSSDDLWTRWEGRLGINLHLLENRYGSIASSVALEAQDWIGGGSPSNRAGDTGLFGIAVGLNIQR